MKLITPDGLERNRLAHERVVPQGPHKQPYGVSGWKWIPRIREVLSQFECFSVLDYGAGKGTLKEKLDDYAPTANYDPITFPGDPEPADLVVCTDVLEHVEPECRDDVLSHIKALANKAVFIVVPLHPPEKHGPHLTSQPLDWWEDLLAEYWPKYITDRIDGPTQRLIFMGETIEKDTLE